MFSGEFESLEQQKAFEKWAFGQSPIAYNDLLRFSWNSYHGDLYEAKQGTEVFGESIGKMLVFHKAYLQGYRQAEQDAAAEEEDDDDDEDDNEKEQEILAKLDKVLRDKLADIQSMLRG